MNKYIQMDLEEKEHFHVLAVDDSHIDRKLLERLLTVSSYQVTIVDSGDKALEFLGLLDLEQNECESSLLTSSVSTTKSSHEQDKQKMKVNLIMTDYSMPGISGYDLLKRVKDSSWKDIPVVVMSSENIQSRINMCLEGGAEEFLLKPVKLSDLKKIHNSITYQNNDTTINDESSVVCNGAKTNIDTNKIAGCNSNKRKAATNLLSSALFDRKPRVEELMPVS